MCHPASWQSHLAVLLCALTPHALPTRLLLGLERSSEKVRGISAWTGHSRAPTMEVWARTLWRKGLRANWLLTVPAAQEALQTEWLHWPRPPALMLSWWGFLAWPLCQLGTLGTLLILSISCLVSGGVNCPFAHEVVIRLHKMMNASYLA